MALPMTRPIKLPSGIYILQKRVPKDVAALTGKSFIKKSLRTKDPTEAKERIIVELNRLEKEWAFHRSEVRTLTKKETVALCKRRYMEWINNHGDNPPDASVSSHELGMMAGVEHSLERLETWHGPIADGILKTEGFRICEDSRALLLREIHRTNVQALEVLQRNADGDYSPDPMANRFPEWEPSKLTTKVTLQSLFDLWKREHLVDSKAAKTVQDFQQKVTSLDNFLGKSSADAVTKMQIHDWCDHLRHKNGLASKTVRDKYLAAIKAVFRVGMTKGIITGDPSATIQVKISKAHKTRGKSFTDEEALMILRQSRKALSEGTKQSRYTKNALRWLPWIYALTGMRGGEAAQLRKEDLVVVDGITCLRVTPDAGSVKTGHYRDVPIHPQLVEEGLVAFIEGSPEGHLFFALKAGDLDAQKKAANVYKAVGRWVRDTAGVVDPKVQPNHAWRHRFKSACRNADVGTEYSEAIMGHEDGKAATKYGELGAKAIYREIRKLPSYLMV